jgi:flagellar transcriptional activator FlhC
MSKKVKSIVNEPRDIQLAIDLIKNGARLQVLEIETTLSRDRLIKLYKEIQGVSPPKGMLPFSTDWFLTWQPNIHASLFILIRKQLQASAGLTGIAAISKAYQIYLEQIPPEPGQEPVLSFTRAWTLVRFISTAMLSSTHCKKCGGEFIVRPQGGFRFVCGLCQPPSRAGKTRKLSLAAAVLDTAES